MRNILIKTISAIFGLVAVVSFFPQDASATCVVNNAKFRTLAGNNPFEFYYEEDLVGTNEADNRPVIYVDIETSDCQGQTINFSIKSDNSFSLDLPVPATVLALHPNQATGNSFTIAFRSGEDHCQATTGINVIVPGWGGVAGEFGWIDCRYYIETTANGVETEFADIRVPYEGSMNLSGGGELSYMCSGYCGSILWNVIPPIIPYGTTLPGGTDPGEDQFNLPPLGPVSALGDDDYLAPLPGFSSSNTCANPPCSQLGNFLRGFFTLLIVIAGILAVIMIVIGGITYASADAFSGKSAGKEMMLHAVFGLILALGGWVILNSINPNLASNLGITIPRVSLVDGYTYSAPGVASIGSSCGPKGNIVCPTCQQIGGGITLKPEVAQPGHDTIVATMAPKLHQLQTALTSSSISWRITEAFTPTYLGHCSPCHYKGTCIDANFIGSTASTPQTIQNFVNAAAAAGLRAVYETNSAATINQLEEETDLQPSTSGGQGNYLRLNGITAPHFSVYNN